MTAARYLLGALILLAAASMLSANRTMVEQAPLEIWRVAIAARDCLGDKMFYRDVEMQCSSPLSFADIRKLDMRADNRALSHANGVSVLKVGN